MNKINHCCEDMQSHVYNSVYGMTMDPRLSETEDKMIIYSPEICEYGLSIFDGEGGTANSYIKINYCPWCGAKLPGSKRDEWFAKLRKLGYEPFEQYDEIPEEFKTSAWYAENISGNKPRRVGLFKKIFKR